MRSRRVTLYDVATEARVSRTTASYVLNGRTQEMRISLEAEQRVREVVARLGYRPNRNAASLRTQRTAAIGVITDYVAGGMFSSRVLVGANTAARALDHLLVIGETEGNPDAERALLQEMVDRQVDGLLYITRAASRITLPDDLHGVPIVTVNCADPDSGAPSVMPDDRGGGWRAADALMRSGITDVVLVGEETTEGAVAGERRLEGIVERLDQAGVVVRHRILCDWSVEQTFEAVHAWLSAGGRAEGLICLNDRIAMGACQALRQLGLRIPEDVSVVSFDGSEVARWLRPTVTSVGIPFFEMGQRGVQILLGVEPAAALVIEMPVILGESVRARAPHRRAQVDAGVVDPVQEHVKPLR